MRARERLSPLDRMFLLSERPGQPLDFAVILQLNPAPGEEFLRRGALQARRVFPRSARLLTRDGWTAADPGELPVRTSRPPQVLLREPMGTAAVRQWLLDDGRLLTRFHHAACDGAGAASWLAAALGSCSRADDQLRLHRRRFTAAAFRRSSSTPLWRRSVAAGYRAWRTFPVPTPDFVGLEIHHVLAAAYLEALRDWNRLHGRSGRLGLWIPVDLRRRAGGFGNGTSRVRVHRVWPDGTPARQRVQGLRSQLRGALRRGEWMLPPEGWTRWPGWIQRLLLRVLESRPGVDWGSSAFSYLDGRPLGPGVEAIQCVTPLHRAHPVVLQCVRLRDAVWCTLTHDSARLREEDVLCLQGMFEQRLRETRQPPCAEKRLRGGWPRRSTTARGRPSPSPSGQREDRWNWPTASAC